MKKEEIHFGDLSRWVFGHAPPLFTLEVAVRAALVMLVMVVLARWLGRRMKGQLSVTELAVILTLGAIIAGPLHIPAVGLAPSLAALACVLVMHRLSSWLAYRSPRVELWQQGEVVRLVRNGCLELPTLQHHAISQEQLFGQLRNLGVAHLGELRRVYLESNGRFSLYKLPDPQPGLSVRPRGDAPTGPLADDSPRACGRCGLCPAPGRPSVACRACGASQWCPVVT